MNKNRGPLLNHLDELEAQCKKGDPTLSQIFSIFGPDGHYVLIVFLILPFLQPMPLFGLSTPFGVLVLTVSLFAYANKPPWIPKRWAGRSLPGSTVLKIAEASERIVEKLSFLIHPRWPFFFRGLWRLSHTLVFSISAILLALPLPIPFSNAFPGWTIFLLALGHLEEDGLLAVLAYLQMIACFVYFFSLATGLSMGLEKIGF